MKKNFISILLLMMTTVNAYSMSGTDLKKHLIDFNGPSSSLWGAYGVGYVLGVSDAMTSILICPPSVTNKELTSIVLSYLFAHPELLDKPADSLVVNALSAKWPCNRAQGNAAPPRPVQKPNPKPALKSDSPF